MVNLSQTTFRMPAIEVKRCFKCGEIKPLSEFSIHRQMADGHLGKCKACARKYIYERRRDPIGRSSVLESDKNRYTTERARRNRVRRDAKYPEKYKARYTVTNAIRDGRLTRKSCQICGEKAQAHHNDYTKPFEIRWLCFKHHRELAHGQIVGELK